MKNYWKKYIAPIAIVFVAPEVSHATQYLTITEAQQECFPNAQNFEVAHVIFTPEQIAEIENISGEKIHSKAQQIWNVKENNQLIGYFVVDYVIGKHMVIDYAIAINLDGTVRKVEILQYRESYGGEIHNRDWLKQFEGKDKNSELKLNQDITNIGGATLSSRHVTEGVKRVLATIDVVRK